MGVEGRGGQGLFQTSCRAELDWIDLFTDTAPILNLLDLRIIKGGGGVTQYLRTLFGQKENFNVYFFTSKRHTTIFCSHYNLFLGKQTKKNWPGERA